MAIHKDETTILSTNDVVAVAQYFPPVKELLTRTDLSMMGLSFSNSHMIQLENAGKFHVALF